MMRFVSLALAASLWLLTGTTYGTPTALRLATTTSTENSGLLRVLLPKFEASTGIKVHVLAVGTGQALTLGRNGDVDVVLVHAPPAEKQFVTQGYGVNRRAVMYNDFVIVGPRSDPATLQSASDVVEALGRIAKTSSRFVSRGDDSGTHKKERRLWEQTDLEPSGDWYLEVGQGMGKALQIAAELDAYTLTDRGTWLAYEGDLPLSVVFEGDERLFNPYGVIAVNPERHPHTNYRDALRFIDWLTSNEGQDVVRNYRKHNRPLFVPMAGLKR